MKCKKYIFQCVHGLSLSLSLKKLRYNLAESFWPPCKQRDVQLQCHRCAKCNCRSRRYKDNQSSGNMSQVESNDKEKCVKLTGPAAEWLAEAFLGPAVLQEIMGVCRGVEELKSGLNNALKKVNVHYKQRGKRNNANKIRSWKKSSTSHWKKHQSVGKKFIVENK